MSPKRGYSVAKGLQLALRNEVSPACQQAQNHHLIIRPRAARFDYVVCLHKRSWDWPSFWYPAWGSHSFVFLGPFREHGLDNGYELI